MRWLAVYLFIACGLCVRLFTIDWAEIKGHTRQVLRAIICVVTSLGWPLFLASAIVGYLQDNYMHFFSAYKWYRRMKGGYWYQVWLPYKTQPNRGRLVWLQRDAVHSKGEWCNDIENHLAH